MVATGIQFCEHIKTTEWHTFNSELHVYELYLKKVVILKRTIFEHSNFQVENV